MPNPKKIIKAVKKASAKTPPISTVRKMKQKSKNAKDDKRYRAESKAERIDIFQKGSVRVINKKPINPKTNSNEKRVIKINSNPMRGK